MSNYVISSVVYSPPTGAEFGFTPANESVIQTPLQIPDSATFNYSTDINGTDRGVNDYLITTHTDILYGAVYVFPSVIPAGLVLEEIVYPIKVWNTIEPAASVLSVIKINFDGLSLQEPQATPYVMNFLGGYDYILTIHVAGPAVINSVLRFEFTGQTTDVPITGIRAVWIPLRPQVSATETIENKTDVLTTHNGKEQRIRTIINPIQKLSYTYKAQAEDITHMQFILGGWFSNTYVNPNWLETVKYEDNLPTGTFNIILDTTNSDFRVGQTAFIWQDKDTNTVALLADVQPTFITLVNSTTEDYYKPQIMPAYLSVIDGNASRSVHPSPNLTEYSLTFRTEEPEYIGNRSYYAESFKGFPVVLDSPYMLPAADTIREEFDTIDYLTGKITTFSKWNRSRHNRQWNKRLHQSEYFSFKKWVHWMRGTQQMLFMPSGEKDFTVFSAIGPGQTELVIEYIGWNVFKSSVPYQYICVKDSRDGKLLMSGVDDVIDNRNGTETLVLRDALMPNSSLVVADIEFSQFMFLMRFATDKQSFNSGSGGIYTFNQELIGVDYEL